MTLTHKNIGDTGHVSDHNEIADHVNGTTNVHGITDTAAVLTTGAIGSSVQAFDATILTAALIGTSVQAHDATLDALGGVTTAADKLIYATGVDTFATTNLTSFARSLIAGVDGPAMSTTLGLRGLQDGAGTTVNTATSGVAKIDLASDISVSSVKLATGTVFTSARCAAVAVLPACTYANGASGVGATLTGNANGALPVVDNVTVVANDRVLIWLQAAPEQNGIYVVTQVGDGSHPFILTRAGNADEAGDYAAGIVVSIQEGLALSGCLYRSRPTTVTMGTTAIRWAGPPRAQVTPADVTFGAARDRIRTFSDFDTFDTAITTTGNHVPGTEFTVNLSGTAAQVAQIAASEARPGVADCQTGTTTTGTAGVTAHTQGVTFDVTKKYRFFALAKTPTVSDGTDTFSWRCGAISQFAIPILSPAGMYFRVQSAGNIEAVCKHSGTETAVDSGLAQTTSYRSYTIIYDEIAQIAWFYVGATLITPTGISTNLPTGDSVNSGVNILKSAGTTSRSVYVDVVEADSLDSRSLNALIP